VRFLVRIQRCTVTVTSPLRSTTCFRLLSHGFDANIFAAVERKTEIDGNFSAEFVATKRVERGVLGDVTRAAVTECFLKFHSLMLVNRPKLSTSSSLPYCSLRLLCPNSPCHLK
jgi:hypothetical protein